MKKLISLLTVLVLCFSLVTAMAEDEAMPYSVTENGDEKLFCLDDLGMQITLPAAWDIMYEKEYSTYYLYELTNQLFLECFDVSNQYFSTNTSALLKEIKNYGGDFRTLETVTLKDGSEAVFMVVDQSFTETDLYTAVVLYAVNSRNQVIDFSSIFARDLYTEEVGEQLKAALLNLEKIPQ